MCYVWNNTYFFFSGLHPALHLYSFGYIMKRSPITVGGQGLINHRGRKNLIWGKAFFIPLPLLKYIIHPYRYWGYRQGLHILITLLSVSFNRLSFRTSGLASCCNTVRLGLLSLHFYQHVVIGNENVAFFFSP